MMHATVVDVSLDGRNGPPNSLHNGHADGVLAPRSEPRTESEWLQYLPGPFQSDDFTARFLLICESIHAPLERTIDTMARYFDPRLAPPELLPWLASWVGIELDENWPLPARRQLILWAARLYRWRGTRRGMREHLRILTGHAPLIVENFDGGRVGQDAILGVNTQVGASQPRPNTIHITVIADDPSRVDERMVRQVVEFQKPAHVGYTLDIRATGGVL
jgi:phage tail-like protein